MSRMFSSVRVTTLCLLLITSAMVILWSARLWNILFLGLALPSFTPAYRKYFKLDDQSNERLTSSKLS